MQPVGALVAIALVSVPLALASEAPWFTLLSAERHSIFDLSEQQTNPVTFLFEGGFNHHHRVTFTVRNDGGASTNLVALDAWWLVTELPTTLWADEPSLAPGETRTFAVDVGPDGLFLPQGPGWLCLRSNGNHQFEPSRCWSVMMGMPFPDDVYPEDVANPTIPATQYGDGPQR